MVARRRARAAAELPTLQATHDAEARGDAWAALWIIESDLQRRGDDAFWRPEKLERLVQLAGLASLLPRWATSRWILAQAAQCLDVRARARVLKAMDIAIDARGGEAALVGTDNLDARAKVLDHDWLFRQVLLYELGGLQDFIGRIAARDLLAGADRIHEWARAPMGGFRLVRESAGALTWSDLATGEEVESLNLGAASLLAPGEYAIGRLVPVEDGAMFESAPLLVPAKVARQVADNPPAWLAAVCAASRASGSAGEPVLTAHGHDFRLLTDVPPGVQRVVAAAAVEEARRAGTVEPIADLTDPEAALLTGALDGWLADVELPWSPWPSVAATLSDPRVVLCLGQSLRSSDAPKLERLAHLLAGPARGICLQLARDLDTAA